MNRVPDHCDLCTAARITPWYYEDDICWIAECEICAVPMVVWRQHGTDPPAPELTHMLDRLRQVAAERFGEFYIDDHMRNIPDHYHAHGRPRGGFFGHGFPRPSSEGGSSPFQTSSQDRLRRQSRGSAGHSNALLDARREASEICAHEARAGRRWLRPKLGATSR